MRDTRSIDNGALFNVIVLIGSLIGTVIVAFTLIMRTLEEYCRISTNEPNKHVVGDQASSSSSSSCFESAPTVVGKVATAERDCGASKGFDADDMGGGDVMDTLPDHGYVALHADSGNECGMEMQCVQSLRPPTLNLPAVIAFAPRHQQVLARDGAVPVPALVAVDRDARATAVLPERTLRRAEPSEMQLAELNPLYLDKYAAQNAIENQH